MARDEFNPNGSCDACNQPLEDAVFFEIKVTCTIHVKDNPPGVILRNNKHVKKACRGCVNKVYLLLTTE